MYSIYNFINLINNKRYIGSTTQDPSIRYNQHIYNVNNDKSNKYNYPLYCAIRKYGIENFKFEILEQLDCSEAQLRKKEKEYIDKYNTVSPNGYNQTNYTEQPLRDPSFNHKISESKRDNSKQVAEIDINYNILNTWRSIVDCAEETKLDEKKIACVCRGERRTTGNRYFCWFVNNELQIPNYIGTTYKGKEHSTQQQKTNKKVLKIDLITRAILAEYDSVALAARENNCDSSTIVKVCKGKRNKCANFFWKYKEE